MRPNGSVRRHASWLEDAPGTGSTGKPPGFSQTPDLDYLAGVWEDSARRRPRVKKASVKTLNAGRYEVSPDPNAILDLVLWRDSDIRRAALSYWHTSIGDEMEWSPGSPAAPW